MKHPAEPGCDCPKCYERDYWRRHPPGTKCACIDCTERYNLPSPPPTVYSRDPYPVMYFPHKWERRQ